MAFYTTQKSMRSAQPSLTQRISAWIAGVITAHNHGRARRDQIAELEAKSDEELAHMGLIRDQIAYHVFHDRLYA